MKKTIVLALAAFFIISAAEAETTIQKVKVFEAEGGPPANFPVGKKVGGASATVYRNTDGIGVIIDTKKLSKGVFTAWLFECSGTSTELCAPHPPIFCSSDTAGKKGKGSGKGSGKGKGKEKVHLACGMTATGMPGTGLSDSRSPFVVLILDHGTIDPDTIHLQLTMPMPFPTVPVQTVKVDAVD
ncbi:exported protein of unknown function [uncultured Woeseiaceae bacterium]|uniref:Uncharacterized protein n=1 Tax=uncultured Woeseiaceae bacterium TaxID=1983305 RepID=A0A7D9D3I6_9GAMM|nr:exported protein of unknown function [uncultured Woeseiaceae bacterium]